MCICVWRCYSNANAVLILLKETWKTIHFQLSDSQLQIPIPTWWLHIQCERALMFMSERVKSACLSVHHRNTYIEQTVPQNMHTSWNIIYALQKLGWISMKEIPCWPQEKAIEHYYSRIDWQAECAALTSNPQVTMPNCKKNFPACFALTLRALAFTGAPLLALAHCLRGVSIDMH